MSDGVIRAAVEQTYDTHDIFKPISWLTKIEFINQLVLGNNLLISVLGEHGSGKTTFSNMLYSMASSEINPYLLSASPLFTREYYLAEVAAQLHYHGDLSIAGVIEHCNTQQKRTLIIIDDAHYLPEDFISEILGALRLQDEQGCFNICLVSNRSMIPTLNKLALDNEDMIHSIELGPLTERETKTYIEERLSKRQGTDVEVTDQQINQFYQLTEGNIVGINSQMIGFFGGRATNKPRVNNSLRPAGIVGGVVVAALVGVMFLSQSQNLTPSEPLINQLPQPALSESTNVVTSDELALDSDIPAYDIDAVRQNVAAAPLRRSDLVAVNTEDNASDDLMAVMDKVIVIPRVMHKQASKKTPQAGKSAPVVAKVMPKAAGKQVLAKSAVAQSRYTIQLLASHNKAELQRFALLHNVQGKTKILRTQVKGNAWYVLAFGEYGQHDQAKQAANKLPNELAALKPWVRAMSDLQKSG